MILMLSICVMTTYSVLAPFGSLPFLVYKIIFQDVLFLQEYLGFSNDLGQEYFTI